jgi:hypothetical protein
VAAVLTGYESDFSDDDPLDDMVENEEVEGENENGVDDDGIRTRRHKLGIPARKARQISSENRRNEALVDIEKVVKSRKTQFEAGAHGLQAYRAQAIQSYFRLVVRNGRKGIEASEMAAESHGFAKDWGGDGL